MRAILEEAARTGAGLARTLLDKPRDPDVFIFEGASWKTAFVGGSYGVPRRRRAEARQTAPSCTPGPIPVKTFWAIDIHDTQTRSLLQTGNPYPSINDRFVDVHTEAKGMSWLRTLPGRSWFPILRLYGPLEVWFDQTWRPGEVQPA